ncbi:hypothetical protein CDIK_2196 [Cucumispora dikerogammari]|nr:hypothetical protein CDIK_2196 [Cucumispora dikerogammari]
MSLTTPPEWPNPRNFKHYNLIKEDLPPPKIPKYYKLFNLDFKKTKTHIKLTGEEYEDLNLKDLREMVLRSYEIFRRILNDPEDKNLLVELRDIHLIMNIKINKAKKWEIKNLL